MLIIPKFTLVIWNPAMNVIILYLQLPTQHLHINKHLINISDSTYPETNTCVSCIACFYFESLKMATRVFYLDRIKSVVIFLPSFFHTSCTFIFKSVSSIFNRYKKSTLFFYSTANTISCMSYYNNLLNTFSVSTVCPLHNYSFFFFFNFKNDFY